MRKVVILLPYFGHFNEYFQLWLNSCAISEDGIQWVVLTDDQTTYRLSKTLASYSAWHIYWDYYRKRLKPSYLIKSLINRFKNRNVLPLSYNYVIR